MADGKIHGGQFFLPACHHSSGGAEGLHLQQGRGVGVDLEGAVGQDTVELADTKDDGSHLALP